MSRKKQIKTEEFKITLVYLLLQGKIMKEVSCEQGVVTSNLVSWKNYEYQKLTKKVDIFQRIRRIKEK